MFASWEDALVPPLKTVEISTPPAFSVAAPIKRWEDIMSKLLIAATVLLIGTSVAFAGPLHDAVKDGDLARLQELIATGADLTVQDRLVGTALHWAASTDNIEAARLLIEAGTDVNLPKIDNHQTALHIAAFGGSVEVAVLLIEAGADAEVRTTYGDTPLHTATAADQANVAKLLIEAGANIEARNVLDFTPLFWAAGGNAVGAIELLVAEGVVMDAKRTAGFTALHYATNKDSVDAVRKLIQLGADVNGAPHTEPVNPLTPLGYAISLTSSRSKATLPFASTMQTAHDRNDTSSPT
jgi:hypothetical protein